MMSSAMTLTMPGIKSFVNFISLRCTTIKSILNSLQSHTIRDSDCTQSQQNPYLPIPIQKLISEYDYDLRGDGDTIITNGINYDAVLPDGRIIFGLNYNGFVSNGNTINIWNLLTETCDISVTDFFQFQ